MGDQVQLGGMDGDLSHLPLPHNSLISPNSTLAIH